MQERLALTAVQPLSSYQQMTSEYWGHHTHLTFPFPVKNDRVRRQAGFQEVLLRSMALSVTTSLRMQAVNASLAGFPANRSRR